MRFTGQIGEGTGKREAGGGRAWRDWCSGAGHELESGTEDGSDRPQSHSGTEGWGRGWVGGEDIKVSILDQLKGTDALSGGKKPGKEHMWGEDAVFDFSDVGLEIQWWT